MVSFIPCPQDVQQFRTAALLFRSSCGISTAEVNLLCLAGVSLQGKDNVAAINYLGTLTVFSRSLAKSSHLYWTQMSDGKWHDWALIGGSSVSLKTDVAVAYNGFSKVSYVRSAADNP